MICHCGGLWRFPFSLIEIVATGSTATQQEQVVRKLFADVSSKDVGKGGRLTLVRIRNLRILIMPLTVAAKFKK